ncbi:E3 ubiquitin-protein ligase Topors [Pelodytes ibericus]
MREKRSKRRKAGGGREESADTVMASPNENFPIDSNFSPKAGTSKLQGHGAGPDASPDSKCPICLDRFDNVSHLDRCLHKFCFRCIQEWSKNKAECPLCKQPFDSIFHSVRAEDDFKEFVLRPTMNGSFGSQDGHRFRYRTTLTRDYRLPTHSTRPSSTQRTVFPPDNGVLFEGLSNPTSQQMGSEIQQMMRRLASRRQASAEGRSMRQIQEHDLINFRRTLYRSGVRVRNVQDGGRYRAISAEFFRRNPACLHRLIPWLKRELTVLFGSNGSLVNIVQHIIMSNVTRYDMESQAFVEDLWPFLLHRTDHFLHEFINFARCPYNIEAYDQHANYDCPAPSYDEGSRSESSIITISPDEVNIRDPDVPESSLAVGQAPWDDETPGPSYSTLEQPTAPVSTTVDISESSDEEPSSSRVTAQDSKNDTTEKIQDAAIDCVIVGFVKPLAERTPELVELSSDSEGPICEVKCEDTKKSFLKPFSDSNMSSRSSSPSSSLYSDKTVKYSHAKKKDKGRMPLDVSSRNAGESRRDKDDLYNSYAISRLRARSRSSDCYSRSSRNKGHENRRRHHSKNHMRIKTPEKSGYKKCKGRGKSRSSDRSLSWRSRTVSLTSESSREKGRSSSRSRNHSRGRSRSRDGDKDFTPNNYRSTYQLEYTYYSRNRHRDGYEQSLKRRTDSRGHDSRPAGLGYSMQSYCERKGSRRESGYSTGKSHHHEKYRPRSRSSSQMNTSGTERTRSDKPSGKRKYKTRHLENQEKEDCSQQNQSGKALEEPKQTVKTSLPRQREDCENELTGTSSHESKQKWRKKARSPSVEIVYEGKAAESTRHHKKKKKKKHKKKRRRERTLHSPAASPIIITIDSDSETPMAEDPSCNNHSILPVKNTSFNSIAIPSQSPTASITDILSGEGVESYSKGDDICSNNGHAYDATGMPDGLHFDDSSDEQLLNNTHTPGKEDSAPDEISLTNEEAPQGCVSPATLFDILEPQENLFQSN